LNLENNRNKKQSQYKKNIVIQRAKKRICYFINSERERQRQKELPSDRKGLYNKQYYLKKSSNYKVTLKNYDIAKNIIKKI